MTAIYLLSPRGKLFESLDGVFFQAFYCGQPGGQRVKLKDGNSVETLLSRGWQKVDLPDDRTIEEWMHDEAMVEAVDGCFVEPDGKCPHRSPSWLMALGIL